MGRRVEGAGNGLDLSSGDVRVAEACGRPHGALQHPTTPSLHPLYQATSKPGAGDPSASYLRTPFLHNGVTFRTVETNTQTPSPGWTHHVHKGGLAPLHRCLGACTGAAGGRGAQRGGK